MPELEPLPFRLGMPGEEQLGVTGMKSVGYRIDGLLHLADGIVTLEWSGTRTTESFSITRMGTDVEQLPVEWLELPVAWIAGTRVKGGWWRPRFEIRARGLEAFEDMPTARGSTLSLKIRRRDRPLAWDMEDAIASACHDAALTAREEPDLLDDDTTAYLPGGAE